MTGWLVSIGLVPVSYALTGPVSDAIGVDETLIGASVAGGVVFFVFLFIPGMRATEQAALHEDEPDREEKEEELVPV